MLKKIEGYENLINRKVINEKKKKKMAK